MSALTVGVDGGQSQIRLRVSDDPEVLTTSGVSHATAGPAGQPDAATAVVEAVRQLWTPGRGAIARLVVGLTTVPSAAAARQHLAARLAAAVDAGEVWVTGDDVTSHAGALGGRSGVALMAGTGVACLAVDATTGAHRSVDGAGYLIGDEGGGFWIGRHGVRAALRAHDGRGPATALTRTIGERLGDLEGLAARVHAGPRPVDTIAQQAVAVLEAADAGDEVAAAIVATAAARLAESARAALALLREPAPALALGGRLLLGHPGLADAVVADLRTTHPDLRVTTAPGAGLDGACALAAAGDPAPYEELITVHRQRP